MNAHGTEVRRRLLALLRPKQPAVRGQAAAARSARASPAAPLGGIRQHEQVQTGEQEQGEREHRQEAHPGVYFLCPTATMLTMTAIVKAMDSQRWVRRTHLFQFNGTSSIILRSTSIHEV